MCPGAPPVDDDDEDDPPPSEEPDCGPLLDPTASDVAVPEDALLLEIPPLLLEVIPLAACEVAARDEDPPKDTLEVPADDSDELPPLTAPPSGRRRRTSPASALPWPASSSELLGEGQPSTVRHRPNNNAAAQRPGSWRFMAVAFVTTQRGRHQSCWRRPSTHVPPMTDLTGTGSPGPGMSGAPGLIGWA